jgi:hypothetical protein
MKKIIFIILAALTIYSAMAQNEEKKPCSGLFQKLVVDLGAVPFSISKENNPTYRTYNFALGYQLAKRLDIRFSYDLMTMFVKEPKNNWLNLDYYNRLQCYSLGLNYVALQGKNETFTENKKLTVAGKFGFTAYNDYGESFFYDISARIYLDRIPYIGLGMNHQFITDEDYFPEMTSLYLYFGLDF